MQKNIFFTPLECRRLCRQLDTLTADRGVMPLSASRVAPVLTGFAISIFFLIAALSPMVGFAQTSDVTDVDLGPTYDLSRGIVPRCNTTMGSDGLFTDPCTPCHIFGLAQNVLNFLWFYVSIPAVTLFLIYGGALMVIPFGGEKSASTHIKGKKVITNALVGLAIIFFGWVFVDTIIKVAGGQRIGAGETGQILGVSGSLGPWNRIQCTIARPGADLSQLPASQEQNRRITGEVTNRVGQAVIDLARRVQNNQQSYGTADCRDLGGTPVGAQTTINEAAAGRPITVCQAGCTGQSVCRPSPSVTLNTQILVSLDTLQQEGFRFRPGSITTGSHTSVSCHYAGDCLDLTPQNPQDYERIRSRLQQLGGEAYCETRSGQLLGSCPLNDSNISHIHVRFRR